MIDSIKRAFNAYSKSPFPFAWGSLLYIFLFIVFLFATIGLALIYFISMSVFNQDINLQSLSTAIVLGVMALIFLFSINGLNAALAKTYRSALLREKMSLTAFFAYAVDKAPVTFAVMLMQDIIWLIFAGPAIALYIYAMAGVAFMDIVVGAYLLFVTFIIQMLFTPLLIYTSLGTDLFGAFRRTINALRRKHVQFLGLYILFAVAWLLNFIPFIGLFSIFFLYPVVYTAMIIMMEGTIKREEEEN